MTTQLNLIRQVRGEPYVFHMITKHGQKVKDADGYTEYILLQEKLEQLQKDQVESVINTNRNSTRALM
ncbi:hypothetical protein BH10BAC2_BH10BAC2_19570 [soil metagenome]